MRSSIIPFVASISILAGLCLSQIFTSSYPGLLQSSQTLQPASAAIRRQTSTSFGGPEGLSLAAAAVASPVSPSNPLAALQHEIKALEAQDGTLERAMARASEALKETEHKVSDPSARASIASARVSASAYSPAQIAADTAKIEQSTKAASTAVVGAQQNLKTLMKKESNLRKEIDELLSKLERIHIVTGAHVFVADGMGGSVFEAVVTKPIGGRASVKIIQGVDAGVEVVEKKVASAEAARDAHVSPSFPQKEKGGDGMGGTNSATSSKAPQIILPKVGSHKGMTPIVSGDDGMGERIVPGAKQPLVVESSTAPASLGAAKGDAGIGENGLKASGFIVPLNAEPKVVAFSHGANVDGIGGTARHLTPRISNAEAASLYNRAKMGDGMGGRVQSSKYVAVVPDVPLTGPMIATDASNDGMGGKKVTGK